VGARAFSRPRFPACAPCVQGRSQPGFCPYTLRRSPDPPEPSLGHPRYLFRGVPPQPNCPPAAVPGVAPRLAEGRRMGSVPGPHPRDPEAPFHCSCLRSASPAPPQRQAAVKLHRDFSPRRGSQDCAPRGGFAGPQAGTVGTSLIHSCTPELSGGGAWRSSKDHRAFPTPIC